MKKIAVLSLSVLIVSACGGSPNQTATNTAAGGNSEMVSSHSPLASATPTPVPKSGTKTKWTQSGNPIDTSKFDADIAGAEKTLKTKPNDADAKKALAEALVARGIALTDARQYASALGDYRKALKLDPANEEAKKWIEQIVGIYESINRDYPQEGEEPPPLPFNKAAN